MMIISKQSLLVALAAYLIGSIPSGFLVAYACGIGDIRQYGSGNIGATNVSRMLGIAGFIIVFLLDAGKAYMLMRTLSAWGIGASLQSFACLCLLLGNCYPIFLSFKGGKGVATLVGALAAFSPVLLLYMAVVWLLIFMVVKTVGIACVASVLFGMLILINYFNFGSVTLFMLLMSFALVIWRHHANISRFIGN